jgi:hypothetical protein
MTIKTFWTIFLKILGIWLVLEGFSIFFQFIAAFLSFGHNQADNIFTAIYISIMLLLLFGIYILILWLFVFKSDWIIAKLRLESGFTEEKIDFNIQSKTVITIAAIVIGGFIFIEGLPLLCREVFMSFQNKIAPRQDPRTAWVIFYFVKTSLGYLVMTNSKFIARFIDKTMET